MTSKINIFKNFSSLILLTLLLLLSFSINLSANEEPVVGAEVVTETGHHAADKEVDMSALAVEHVSDAHTWHFWGEGHDAFTISLPVILKGNSGFIFFMSSEFHHDVEGKVVVVKNGERFVNYKEHIYYANETANSNEQYITLKGDEKDEELTNAAVLDFSITKNVVQMFICFIIILLLFSSIAKAYKKQGVTTAPKGKQSFFEPLIVFVRDDLGKAHIGAKADKFTPYLLTVFFLILIGNIIGLIPIAANLTGNIGFTLALAVCTFVVTNFNGKKYYWSHVFTPHVPKATWILIIPIEIVGLFTKPIALMIRLFANITAGHIVIISLIGLIFVFKSWAVAPVSVALTLFVYVLEVLVAFLQAYIFTMFTAVYIGSALAEPHEEGYSANDELATNSRH